MYANTRVSSGQRIRRVPRTSGAPALPRSFLGWRGFHLNNTRSDSLSTSSHLTRGSWSFSLSPRSTTAELPLVLCVLSLSVSRSLCVDTISGNLSNNNFGGGKLGSLLASWEKAFDCLQCPKNGEEFLVLHVSGQEPLGHVFLPFEFERCCSEFTVLRPLTGFRGRSFERQTTAV